MSAAPGRTRAVPPHALWGCAGVLALLLCLVLTTVPGSTAAFTAQLTNTTDTVGTNAYFTCQAAMSADGAYYAYPLDDASPTNGTSARDLSGSNRAGTYQTSATHSSVSACTRDGGGSTTFNGSSNFVSTPNALNQQTFTLEVWFRTTTSSGALMGFSNSLLALVPTNWDRMVYFTSGGRLVFGVYPGSYQTVTTTTGYADGAWHHMMATLGPAGMFLYVDGAPAASSTNTGAQSYSGYLRVGYNYLSGWPGVVGSNYYFNGQLGHAAYYQSQLSASAAASHAAAGR